MSTKVRTFITARGGGLVASSAGRSYTFLQGAMRDYGLKQSPTWAKFPKWKKMAAMGAMLKQAGFTAYQLHIYKVPRKARLMNTLFGQKLDEIGALPKKRKAPQERRARPAPPPRRFRRPAPVAVDPLQGVEQFNAPLAYNFNYGITTMTGGQTGRTQGRG